MSPPASSTAAQVTGAVDEAGGLLWRVAVSVGIARARLPLAVALALAFGLMLLTALTVVLGLVFYAGAANTRQLTADRSNLLLDWLQEEIDNFFQPVAFELPVIAAEMADDADAARLLLPKSALHGILAATPQVQGVLYLTTDLKAYRYRRLTGAESPEDWSQVADMRALMAAARADAGVTWGALVYSSELRRTVINARLPIVRDGRLRGLLFAAVSLETMVRYVDNLSRKVGQPVFVLEGRDRVIAAPSLDTANLGPDRPLPLLAEAGDPVLAAIWAGATERLGILERGVRGGMLSVSALNEDWAVLYRQVPGYGDRPWILGTYLPARSAGVEVRRLLEALALSLVALVVAVVATFWLGRRMAQPVQRLADAAGQIQKLKLDDLADLPRSRIRELDQAARAFNAMRRGLGWFETYVPRRLVGQLMASSSPDVMASREVELTVMFTDIVGFSRLAERLDAAEAAALLNHHFELLAGCVLETDGTVDKFLGDGMMAFWGAPVAQPDHAARAIRAALLMRDRVRADPDERSMRLRIGLHTGPALVGNIGSRDRLNYTLVGDTVNVAQRLEQLGKQLAPDADIVILASATTAAHGGGLCAGQSLGAQQLRGRDEWMEVFALN